MKLFIRAVAASLFGLVFFGVLLFWPAGTFDYWQAWVSSRSSLRCRPVPPCTGGLRKPEVLRRRMKAGPIAEARPAQKIATTGTIAMVVAVA